MVTEANFGEIRFKNTMTADDLLKILISIGFPAKYWALCDRYPRDPSSTYSPTKQEILNRFQELGSSPRYDSRDRSYSIEAEQIGDISWSALFQKQRSGSLELFIYGETQSGVVGSNLAVLAYQAKQLSDPGFKRAPFSGTPPYPRPSLTSQAELPTLLADFITLVREVKDATRLATIVD